MGQEISQAAFTEEDFERFASRLNAETDQLEEWFASARFATAEPTVGFELETWLVDPQMQPAPKAETLLAGLDDPLVVAELARFNVEINGAPVPLRGASLTRLAEALTRTLERCNRVAAGLGTRLMMIGILPTVLPEHLTLEAMTPRLRYQALNQRIFSLRRGLPLGLVIDGHERLELTRHDVMLEAAATSFQIHLRVTPETAARVYNASKIISGLMVAISANSPYLFGRDLWSETRIPLFEQAVSIGGPILQERVNFGFRYAECSIMETFRANLDRYPILLPARLEDATHSLPHLRLHNGTIWRWNRPLLGFDPDGRAHLRIEHRVLPAGPTVVDMVANAALYLGAVSDLAQQDEPPERRIPFAQSRVAFYRCARDGLDAEIQWLDGHQQPVVQILREDLVPRAARGLRRLGVDPAEAQYWLGIIAGRVRNERTGSSWQRQWVAQHRRDLSDLTAAYLERQRRGTPVHEWV
ncbi:glutamate--cysteine ligase [Thiocapsa imhoffii]|uniref:Glutamate--cysteine ligase n=1 Tax=Thiocapsa imhoffii TaxID=382777 RepID=A0A9X1B797_9GAMM|nr:glutamate-cysteine ligase family protein [Thiocapsa imhoffii]MBK1643442.1 glutamate--cysteine ligase [Thiocapsa imhoffii]